MEFPLIVKVFFSKDHCALWGHDGMAVCDIEKVSSGLAGGQVALPRRFSY